jgi:trans-2,3-dihydro-3-hydroxyanthranilate isomerase
MGVSRQKFAAPGSRGQSIQNDEGGAEMSVIGEGLEYWLCDVFTDKQLAGNQLAVFADAGHLSTEQMQSIAREMNLSETTFLLRREEREEQEHGITVRIFTVQEELPFAGHPTLGTASMLREYLTSKVKKADGRETVVLNLKAGKVPVHFESGSRFGEMTQPNPLFGALHEAALVATALGLKVDDLAPSMPIQTTSTGVPFVIVPLASLDVLSRLRVPMALAESYLRDKDAKFFYCIARDPSDVHGNEWRARMQFYNGEDPATGSAAGCAISYLVRHGFVASDKKVHLRQGVEMGRPSDLYLRAHREGDTVSEIRVGGSTVPVAKGRFFLA